MKARFVHRFTHVLDKEASIKFYEEALGFKVVREMGSEDGSWTNTFMANEEAPFEIELTWNRGQVEPYASGKAGLVGFIRRHGISSLTLIVHLEMMYTAMNGAPIRN